MSPNKMNLNPYKIPDANINSKWIKDLNLTFNNVKLFQEDKKKTTWQLLLGYDTNSTSHKAKTDNLNFMKDLYLFSAFQTNL